MILSTLAMASAVLAALADGKPDAHLIVVFFNYNSDQFSVWESDASAMLLEAYDKDKILEAALGSSLFSAQPAFYEDPYDAAILVNGQIVDCVREVIDPVLDYEDRDLEQLLGDHVIVVTKNYEQNTFYCWQGFMLYDEEAALILGVGEHAYFNDPFSAAIIVNGTVVRVD